MKEIWALFEKFSKKLESHINIFNFSLYSFGLNKNELLLFKLNHHVSIFS